MSKEAFSLVAAMFRRLRLAEAFALAKQAGAGGGAPGRRARGAEGWDGDDRGGGDGGDGGGPVNRTEDKKFVSLNLRSWDGGQPMVQGFLKKRRWDDG